MYNPDRMKKKSKKPFAKKSLGQNFLQSTEVRDGILETAGDITGKNILEIGPGLGFLTAKLLSNGAHLTAVELDDRASEILTRDFGHMENFHLIQGDILQQDLDQMFFPPVKGGLRGVPYSIIANIPYNITSPILRKCLSKTNNKPEFMLLMVQKEVGQKICPRVGGDLVKNFRRSILSLSVEIFAEAELLFEVGRECFSPAPKVDSAIIKITTRPQPLVAPADERDFFTVVNAGFSRKRKKLANVLGAFFGVESAKLLGSIDGNRRAETLNVDEWLEIMRNFQKHIKP